MINSSRALTRLAAPALPSGFASSTVRAHTIIMAMLFIGALAVAYALLPDDGERIAMLERDGKTAEARQILETAFASGDRRQRTVFQLEGLYEAAGDLPKARQMIEELARLRPRDFTVQRQLGQFYRQTHDEPAYIRSLIAQLDLRYTEASCRELVGILRRRGDYDEELAALTKCRLKGYRRPDDMIRLASLHAVSGDIKESAAILKAVDDLRRLKTDRERFQLFNILLDADQPREAQRRAVRWIKASKDEELALTFVQRLVALKKFDLAIELARETSVPGDRVFLSVAEIMAQRSETAAARDLLRGWLDKATVFDEPLATRFIAAALDAESPVLAFNAARRIGLEQIDPELAATLVTSLEMAGREVEAETIRTELKLAPRRPNRPVASRMLERIAAKTADQRASRLAAWRADLWTRVQKDNRAPTTGLSAAQKPRATQLKALKRARKATTLVRRFKPGKQQQSPLFGLDP